MENNIRTKLKKTGKIILIIAAVLVFLLWIYRFYSLELVSGAFNLEFRCGYIIRDCGLAMYDYYSGEGHRFPNVKNKDPFFWIDGAKKSYRQMSHGAELRLHNGLRSTSIYPSSFKADIGLIGKKFEELDPRKNYLLIDSEPHRFGFFAKDECRHIVLLNAATRTIYTPAGKKFTDEILQEKLKEYDHDVHWDRELKTWQ